jgi:hypothetical protein
LLIKHSNGDLVAEKGVILPVFTPQLAAGRVNKRSESYELTGGNPFYVMEVLTHSSLGIPDQVRIQLFINKLLEILL